MGNLTSTLTIALNDDVSGKAGRAASALRGLGASGKDLARLGAVSPEMDKLTKRLEALNAQASKVGDFRAASKGLKQAGSAMRAARQDVASYTAKLDEARAKHEALKGTRTGPANPNAAAERTAASADVRKWERALRGANATLAETKTAFVEQGQAVRGMRADLSAAGVPLKQLRTIEADLKTAIAGTNAELARQPALMAATAKRTQELARSSAAAMQASVQAGKQARVQRIEQERVVSAARASASGDMLRGMGGAGRVEASRLASERHLSGGMGAPARAAAAARAELAREQHEARLARWADRREVAGVAAASAGVYAGHKGKTIAQDAITSAAEFDIAVRKQREFTDINGGEQTGLLTQAKRIGQETQFSNIDVVRAQTAAMQGLPSSFAPGLKAAVAEGIVGNVRNFATLMETDLKEGSEIIRGYLQQTGKDISTKEKALFEANKATNQLVKMAKVGGMDGEDVKNFSNYAMAAATASGLSTDDVMALGALARRGGLRGDVAGVAVRSMASKIVAPTSQGIAALNAAGIKHSDYVRMPDALSTDALEGQFRNTMGKGFTPAVRAKMDKINADKALIADRAKYVEAVTDAAGPMLGKTKKGTVRASDSKVAAKAAGAFHKVSGISVDAIGLLDAAMSKQMTLPQLNAWLTDKHGGKAAITQKQWDEFKSSREGIKKAGDDPDWAKKKADEVFAGLGGSIENLKGSFQNLTLAIGNANAGLIKSIADSLGKGVDTFSDLPEGTQQALSLGAGGAAAAGGLMGTIALAKRFLGIGGKAAAVAGGTAGGAGATAAGATVAAGEAAVAGAGAGAAGVTAGGVLGGGILATGAVAGGALDMLTPGSGWIGEALTGRESSLRQTIKALAAERSAAKVPAPAGWDRRNVAGGLDGSGAGRAGADYAQTYGRSRGGLGVADFLLGQEKVTTSLPVPAGMGAGAAPKFDPTSLDAAGAKVEEIKAKLATLGDAPVAPKVDTSGFDGVGARVDEAAAKVASLSSTVATPQVDASAIDTLISKVMQAITALGQLRGAAASANADIGRVNASPGAGSTGRVRGAVTDNHE